MPLPRFMEKALAATKWPQLLIEKGKHNTSYYLVGSHDELLNIAKKLVKARTDIGYICEPDEHPYKFEPELAKLTNEEIDKIPSETVRAATRLAKRMQDQNVSRHEEDKRLWQLAQLALTDGEAAWELLRSRSDYEYESVELKGFDKP